VIVSLNVSDVMTTGRVANDTGLEIAPGPVLWPEDESFDELSRQRIISHTPLRREGTPDDIAGAVHFLLAEARYVTGETISVDGGRHVAI
jgi:pteridine reductase